VKVGGKKVTLQQVTDYPWNGDVTMNVKQTSGTWTLMIRIPGWVRNQVVPSDLYNYVDAKHLSYSIKVNGEEIVNSKSSNSKLDNGYVAIERKWKKGDKVSVHFDMEPRLVRANGRVAADRGRAAIERGPLVYCAEWPDNTCNVLSVLLNQEPKFKMGSVTIADTKVQTLQTDAQTLKFDANGRLTAQDEQLTLIPYYAWAHRGNGNMAVWIPIDLNATTPALPPSIASESKVTASAKRLPALSSINDRLVPVDGNDRSIPYTHWWPKNNSTEWLAYEFKEEATVSTSTVYWYDDQPWQGCKVPDSWKLYYMNDAGQWVEVQNPSDYGTKKGVANTVNFTPVRTKAMKLEFVQPKDKSCGLYEWSIK
jgi:hypothetical protein